jgi:hypothetical protein
MTAPGLRAAKITLCFFYRRAQIPRPTGPFASKNFVQKNALIEIEKNSLWKRARRAKLKKIHLGNERD